MRRHIATAAAILSLALAAGAPAGAPAQPAAPPAQPVASAAKTCRPGYVHAVIGGAQKCLRVGEFCAHRYDRQYRKYGFRCIHRDARGNYHLT